MMTMMTIAMMAMIMKKATIVIWEPMSLVCAILATIRMHINDSDIHWYKIGLLLEMSRPRTADASKYSKIKFFTAFSFPHRQKSLAQCQLLEGSLQTRWCPSWASDGSVSSARRPSTNSSLSFTELLQPFFSSMTDYWPQQSTCHVHRFRPLRKLELQIWWLKLLFDLQPDGHLLLFSKLNPLICSCKFLSGWPSRNSTSMCPFSKKSTWC